MSKNAFRFALGLAAVLALLVLNTSAKPAATSAAAAAPCNDVSWLNPPNPPVFLTDINQAPGTGNCQFEEFASWNFMALVLGDNPRFESWPTAEQVFRASGQPICSGAALGSDLSPIIQQTGKTLQLNSIIEATGQPMVDQHGRYVQYEIRVDPVLCASISSCQLYTQSCVNAAAASSTFRWPSGTAGTTTPGSGSPGVGELKLAWRVMETCNLPDSPRGNCQPDDLDEFFWVGGITIDDYSPKLEGPVSNVTIGLVGFHLIQKTPSRPEFVWATWEHISNDPVCPGSDNSLCLDPSHATGGVGTASHWSFYNPDVTPSPEVNNPPACPDPTLSLTPTQANCFNQPYYDSKNPQTQPDTETCRLDPCGGGDQTDVADLNEAIRTKLAGNVWWNYFLVGTVWGNSTAAPTGPSDSAGSIYLANTTMETYFQTTATTSNQFNCFTCHSSTPFGTISGGTVNVDFVHSLIDAQQTQPVSCGADLNSCLPSLLSSHTTTKPK